MSAFHDDHHCVGTDLPSAGHRRWPGGTPDNSIAVLLTRRRVGRRDSIPLPGAATIPLVAITIKHTYFRRLACYSVSITVICGSGRRKEQRLARRRAARLGEVGGAEVDPSADPVTLGRRSSDQPESWNSARAPGDAGPAGWSVTSQGAAIVTAAGVECAYLAALAATRPITAPLCCKFAAEWPQERRRMEPECHRIFGPLLLCDCWRTRVKKFQIKAKNEK